MASDGLSAITADIASLRAEIAACDSHLSVEIAALRAQLAAARSLPGVLAGSRRRATPTTSASSR
jgi:hypothetical protein